MTQSPCCPLLGDRVGSAGAAGVWSSPQAAAQGPHSVHFLLSSFFLWRDPHAKGACFSTCEAHADGSGYALNGTLLHRAAWMGVWPGLLPDD
eukprot:CAMPEP_0174350034 /NCGR_PEP_ID=MMETSP0811_2-20130205/6966_1 /TAXON_ID=73025 ORGANISM="Eutreptiella gymnastica-like, Strain CCMP1594" /NCGR_SAMPLE_ID=MMETSP0811_2 /ASSEMBLY_ACC=CAM_ASM_000667 /LENGTH=91 /DNA_ID=CAMNT_0015477955 /DNA_START=1113 /DNA_END=1388 /DNA_ORIENTATION=-